MVSKCNYKLVSFGINCKVSIALTDLGIKQETYLFDWVQSNPQIILDCMKDNFKKYNNFNNNKISDLYGMHKRYPINQNYEEDFGRKNKQFNTNDYINDYGMCFTHYIDYDKNKFTSICQRRVNRFFKLLKEGRGEIIFIYFSDDPINIQIDQYKYLLQIEKVLIEYYPKLKFKILSIHNLKKDNTENIYNFHIDKEVININSDYINKCHKMVI